MTNRKTMKTEIKEILKKHSSFQDQKNGFRLWSIHQDKWDDIAKDIESLVKESDSLPCVSDKIPKPLDWVYSKLNVKKGSTFKSPEISIRVCASWISEYVTKYYR